MVYLMSFMTFIYDTYYTTWRKEIKKSFQPDVVAMGTELRLKSEDKRYRLQVSAWDKRIKNQCGDADSTVFLHLYRDRTVGHNMQEGVRLLSHFIIPDRFYLLPKGGYCFSIFSRTTSHSTILKRPGVETGIKRVVPSYQKP